MINKFNRKNNFINFDSMNESLEKVYIDSFDIFISLMRELDYYENNLINCTTIGEFKPMTIKNINEINVPKFGNLIMDIITNSHYSKETKDKFTSLYLDNACKELIDYKYELENCESFWSGVLLKGMVQAIAQMGVSLGIVIDELQSLNNINNGKTLLNLINKSAFIEFMEFNEYYLFKAFDKTSSILKIFREENIQFIIKKIKIIAIFYIFISIILFCLLIYFIYSFKYLINSFLNFIVILPSKFISKDTKFIYEIIKFGHKYF